jgi:AcrR family transcriptional regulator
MSDVVKSARPYSSTRRQEAAQATKRVIVKAAKYLFERDGYIATSIQAIAKEAGVAAKTIYLIFGSKANALRAVWSDRLAPGEADVPVLERVWYRQVLEADNPRRKLRLMVEHSIAVKKRSAKLIEVIRSAASDPEIRALWDEIDAKLHHVAEDFAKQLAAAGDLQPEVSVRKAADALWALNHPTVWQLLVVQQGWTPDAYAVWVEHALASNLLQP